jgi:hypothetical protein
VIEVSFSLSIEKQKGAKKKAYHALLIVLPKILGLSADMCPTGGSISFAAPAIV